MKKLVLMTAIGVVMAGVAGCRTCDWFRRGAPASAVTMPAPMYCDPCAPSAAPCDPCGPSPTTCAPGAPMVVAPGETFVPGPTR